MVTVVSVCVSTGYRNQNGRSLFHVGHVKRENQITTRGPGPSQRGSRLQSERGRNEGLDPRERGCFDVQ